MQKQIAEVRITPPAKPAWPRPRPKTDKVAAKSAKDERTPRVRHVVTNTFRLGYLLHDVSRMRRTLFDQHLKPEGLTRSQWWVLATLSRKDGTGTVSTDLARQLSVGKITVGGLIERLESTGYVYRRASRTDRRSKLIFITAKGHAVIARMRNIVEPLNRQITQGMTPADVEKMERLLIQMKKNVIAMLANDPVIEDDEVD